MTILRPSRTIDDRCKFDLYSIYLRTPVITIPVDAVPVDPVPIDTVPVDPVPIDTVPVDTVPVHCWLRMLFGPVVSRLLTATPVLDDAVVVPLMAA